jgi:hypothetical protein
VDIKQAGQDQSPALVGSADRQQQPQARGATELEPSPTRSNHRAPPRRPERKVGKRPPGRPPKGKQWSDAEVRGASCMYATSGDATFGDATSGGGGDIPPAVSNGRGVMWASHSSRRYQNLIKSCTAAHQRQVVTTHQAAAGQGRSTPHLRQHQLAVSGYSSSSWRRRCGNSSAGTLI